MTDERSQFDKCWESIADGRDEGLRHFAWSIWKIARAAPAQPLPASVIVMMYAEQPTSDQDMIDFAREVERAHGIGKAPAQPEGEK